MSRQFRIAGEQTVTGYHMDDRAKAALEGVVLGLTLALVVAGVSGLIGIGWALYQHLR